MVGKICLICQGCLGTGVSLLVQATGQHRAASSAFCSVIRLADLTAFVAGGACWGRVPGLATVPADGL